MSSRPLIPGKSISTISFETITDTTSWFLPAGVRLASLILLDKRYWAVIAIAEFTGIYAVNSTEIPYTTVTGTIVGTLMPVLIYMAVVYQFLKSNKAAQFDNVKNIITLFTWMSLGAFLTATALVTSLMFQEQVLKENLLSTILLFMLGDMVGIIILVPILYAIKQIIENKHRKSLDFFLEPSNMAVIFLSLLIKRVGLVELGLSLSLIYVLFLQV